MRARFCLGLVFCLPFFTENAWADVPARRWDSVFRWRSSGSSERYLVDVDSADAARALGLRPVTNHLAVLSTSVSERRSAFARLPENAVAFSPPRYPLLSEATRSTRAASAREEFGLDGSGTLVAVIDTGVDVAHPAFRKKDGSTRVEWLLEFGTKPLGLHPELEEKYGCERDANCAVLSAEDIDTLLDDNIPGNEPNDRIGHGTHVLSTIAGANGDSDPYAGIAPAAGLMVVAIGGGEGTLADADILTGAQFLFDRAAEAEKPLALNLSLGSSFGNHDGSSALERGLSELLGEGRAIVVAAGNDGSLYEGRSGFPAPFGKHMEVSVPSDGVVDVPLVLPGDSSREYSGEIYLWLATGKRDELEVQIDAGRGKRSEFAGRGTSVAFKSSDLGDPDPYDIAVLFGVKDAENGINERSAVLGFSGKFHGGRVLHVRLRGKGYVSGWIEATGDLSSLATAPGVLFPRARVGGTVGVPATAAALISVGASVNRNSWTTFDDYEVNVAASVGELASFSGAGPTSLGWTKPDVVAPGEFLIAAMSSASDPRGLENPYSQFNAPSNCGESEQCLVVDELHGVASGTSMAAPLVTGATALLLQREPKLKQEEIRAFLRGGARAEFGELPPSWYGAGYLDVVGSLLAQEAQFSGKASECDANKSVIVFGDTFLRPREEGRLEAMALLRDRDGAPARAYPLEELNLEVESGTGELLTSFPGHVRILVSGGNGTGGRKLGVRLLHRGQILASGELPIGVDPATTKFGFEASGAGCSVAVAPRGHGRGLWMLGLVALAIARKTRKSRV